MLTLDRPGTVMTVYHRAAFLIDDTVAPYIILAHDKSRGRVPGEIQEIIDDGKFDVFATLGELPGDYHDTETAYMVLNMKSDVATRIKHAFANIETEFPQLTNRELKITARGGPVVFIPSEKPPELFEPSYSGPDELLDEFKKKLAFAEIPKDYDYWRNVCYIVGHSMTETA